MLIPCIKSFCGSLLPRIMSCSFSPRGVPKQLPALPHHPPPSPLVFPSLPATPNDLCPILTLSFPGLAGPSGFYSLFALLFVHILQHTSRCGLLQEAIPTPVPVAGKAPPAAVWALLFHRLPSYVSAITYVAVSWSLSVDHKLRGSSCPTSPPPHPAHM